MKTSGAASARHLPRLFRPMPGSIRTGTTPALKSAKVRAKKSSPGLTMTAARAPARCPTRPVRTRSCRCPDRADDRSDGSSGPGRPGRPRREPPRQARGASPLPWRARAPRCSSLRSTWRVAATPYGPRDMADRPRHRVVIDAVVALSRLTDWRQAGNYQMIARPMQTDSRLAAAHDASIGRVPALRRRRLPDRELLVLRREFA